MNILGKDGLLYNILAITIAVSLPLLIIIFLPAMWLHSKITGKDF